ncbi:MAG: hypothetical protein A4E19_14260 [Nitrospira sp. SG-bin1]|nr:MAG: hypothetical protein A4E19_14260 [Nitrospira sp. SG-bin1]
MSTPASVHGHPIHPMIVPIPIGLWIFSLVCDVVYDFGLGGPLWKTIAHYALVGGLIGAIMAAVPGAADYRSLSNPRVVSIARLHMLLNLSLVFLYGVNAWLRYVGSPDALVPSLLSWVGVVVLGISGWLGGELVYVRRVGVGTESGDHEASRTQQRAA